ALEPQITGGKQTRKRDVVGGLAGVLRLLTHAFFTMDHRRLGRIEPQVEAKFLHRSFERLLVPAPLGRPVSVPHAPLLEARAGYTWTCAIEALARKEALAVDIGKRQVSQIQVVDAPD